MASRPLALTFSLLAACTTSPSEGQDEVAQDGSSESAGGTVDTSESGTSESTTDTGSESTDTGTSAESTTTDSGTSEGTSETADTADTADTAESSGSEGGGVCGDFELDPGEECDGIYAGTLTCQDFGFDAGELLCSPFCTVDASSCFDPGSLPNGASCTADDECDSANCYVVPFLGGVCGECNEDADCMGGGCTAANPFDSIGSTCNMGELGGGCESSAVCQPGLVCGNTFDLLGLIQINTCGECTTDAECEPGTMCAPLVDIAAFSGTNTCILPGSVPLHGYCDFDGSGNAACSSGLCSSVDLMGLAQIGACGECNVDADCGVNGTCFPGQLDLATAQLTGSTCQ